MTWRLIIKRFIIVLTVCIVLGSHRPSWAQHPTPSMKSQDEALHTLQQYLQLRLHNADWKDYSKFVTWPDEPGWDCNWVVSAYDLGTPKNTQAKIGIPATYKRLGLYCYDFEFKPDQKVVTIGYELVKRPGGWKVSAPIPDYPDISAEVLLKSLRASAEDLHESSERRAQFSEVAHKIADAVDRAGRSQ